MGEVRDGIGVSGTPFVYMMCVFREKTCRIEQRKSRRLSRTLVTKLPSSTE